MSVFQESLAVDVNLKGAGDVPLFQRQAFVAGRDLDVHPVPENLGTAVGQNRLYRLEGIEAQPVRVVKTRLCIGGVVSRLHQPSRAKRRGLAQIGGVEDLGLEHGPGKRDTHQRTRKNDERQHTKMDQTGRNAASKRVHSVSSGFAFTLPPCKPVIPEDSLLEDKDANPRTTSPGAA